VVLSSVVRFHPERGPRPAEQARVSALSTALRTSQNHCDEVLGACCQTPSDRSKSHVTDRFLDLQVIDLGL
jgi:hypothetical protein